MADTKINVELSPQSMVKSLQDISDQTKKLAQVMEESLGKKAVQNVDNLQKAAEKGSNQIGTFFRNLSTRIKEDLKTAFDATGLLAGAKLVKEMAEGAKSVFEMEKAFDRLNTRLQLTGRSLLDFKKNVGSAVANTGQKLEDILPGVETMAAKGNVRSPAQLQQMAGMLAQVRATTGEEVSGLADTVVDILKSQQKEVTAGNTRKVLDTLQSARTHGAFKSAGEAGSAVASIAPYAKQLGLGTEQLGGLAAVASHAGPGGQNVLQQLLSTKKTEQGGVNAILGQEIFGKNGKFNPEALGKVDVNRFGKYSQQAISEATGMQGANGADLARFVDAFKNGMKDFGEVTNSFGETQRQFDTATDNFASNFAKFKQKTIEAAREVGEGLSTAAHAVSKGDWKGAGQGLSAAGSAAWENKGTLTGATVLSTAATLLASSGINGLLGRLPGMGGVAGKMGGSLVGGAIAEATGVQNVYVVNASDIGGGVGDLPGMVGKLGGGMLGMIGPAVMGAATALVSTPLRAISTGLALGQGAKYIGEGGLESDVGSYIKKNFGKEETVSSPGSFPVPAIAGENGIPPAALNQIANSVKEGASNATVKMNGPHTNPSSVQPRGAR